MDIQVTIFAAVVVILTSSFICGVYYRAAYNDMLHSLRERVYSIYEYIESELDTETYRQIRRREDQKLPVYQQAKELLEGIKNATGVRYLYTAGRGNGDELIYLVDGLDMDSGDFRYPGDPIEPEICPDMLRALAGEIVLPGQIKDTQWGKIFIAYFPIHDEARVVGVLGIEFEAEHQYRTYRALLLLTPLVLLITCALSAAAAVLLFRRISNPSFQDLSNTDQLTGLKNRNAYDLDMKNWNASSALDGIGVVVMDLNDLKRVNDTMGHSAGDDYIALAAAAMKRAAGKSAILYRVGGDEFTALFPAASGELLENFIGQVDARLVPPENWVMPISISSGAAIYDHERDGDLYSTCRRADMAMYERKHDYHCARDWQSQARQP